MIDLIVGGGGPAGLAAALYARRRGLDVVVLEPREPPIDKACGEGLMPPAVAALDDLGIAPLGVPFHGIRYVDGEHSVDGRFRDGPGLGVRRTELHRALAAAADAAGIARVTDRVHDIGQDGRSVSVNGHRARWLIGADGLHSQVRTLAGIPSVPAPAARARYGLRRHYAVRPWTDLVEVHWAAAAEAYVTPVAADCVGVAILGGRSDRSGLLDAFPAVRDRLAGAPAVSEVRGAGPLRQRLPRRVAGRVLLVGDAAGYVDALTGEGLGLALACARAAVDCLVRDAPGDYERYWRSITRDHRMLTTALLVAARRPVLRSRIVPLASRLPWLFTAAVNHLARPPHHPPSG